MRLSDYLDASLIVFLDEKKRDKAILKMVAVADTAGFLPDRQEFHKAILDREKIVSTGIGMGVALPHAKHDAFSKFFIILGIQKKQGIEWNSLDGAPVRLVFMIGGPSERKGEYLKLLSLITKTVKSEEVRKQILQRGSSLDVLALLQNY